MYSQKWDKWFLGLAQYTSTASKDPSTKVGAVIIDPDRTVVSVGYNGFPRGVMDDPVRLNNRDVKLKYMVHAERNALLFANKPTKECCIFTYPFMPCSVCAGLIIQSGIKRVVSFYVNNSKWAEEFKIASIMFQEANVKMVLYEDSDCYHFWSYYK